MREMAVPSTRMLERRVTQRLVSVWSVYQTRKGLSDLFHGGVFLTGIGSINESCLAVRVLAIVHIQDPNDERYVASNNPRANGNSVPETIKLRHIDDTVGKPKASKLTFTRVTAIERF